MIRIRSTMSHSRVTRCFVAASLLAATLLSSSPAAAGGPVDQRCTKGDVTALAKAGPHVAKAYFGGSHSRHAMTWPRCQFRLYDDNDTGPAPDNPEIPHVFTVNDYFLAGLFLFDNRPARERAAAIADFATVDIHFYFGPSHLSDAALPEIPLSRTCCGYVVLAGPDPIPDFGGRNLWMHHYTIFKPGSLAAGTYRWRSVISDPTETSVYYGSVTILAE